MTLSIIVISYNTCDMTLACLKSIYAQVTLKDFDIILIDNHSTDGSVDAIRKQFPLVRLLALNENLGFAKANNYAAQFVDSEYFLLLNPDTVVLNGAIDQLLTFAKSNSHAGIWGGKTIFSDGSLNPGSCWQKITAWGLLCRGLGLAKLFPESPLFNPEAYGGWKRDNVRSVDIVSGCFLLITRSLWNELGGFDEHFFMYGEDADLCLRAKKLGYNPMITPDAEIIHYGGASESTRSSKLIKLIKAKLMLIDRHWSSLSKPIGFALFMLWPFNKFLVAWLTVYGLNKKTQHYQEWITVWNKRKQWLPPYHD